MMRRLWALVAILYGVCLPALADEPTSRVPPGFVVEEPSSSAELTKIVLVAGSNFFKPGQHEYIGGCAALADLLRQTPGVFPVLALDWPHEAKTLAGAKSIVLFADGGDKHSLLSDRCLAETKKAADAGVGLVFFHQGVDVPKDLGDTMRTLAGAAFEKGYSARAHWVHDFSEFPTHPILRGVTPFKIDDGWLYKLRFVEGMKGITPLLRTTNPKDKKADPKSDEAIVAWAYERDGGGRSFAFTGCHLHASFAEEGYRRFLTNGILWTAGIDPPASGASVRLDADNLDRYLVAPPAGVKTTSSK